MSVVSGSASTEKTRVLRSVRRLLIDQPSIVLTVILILTIVATNLASPGFVTPHQLSNALLYAAPLGVLAAGQTLAVLTAGIDLSVGYTATAAAYMMAELGAHGTPVAVLAALSVGLLIGLLNGIGIGIFGVQPLIMTLGMSGVVTGALTLFSMTFTNGVPLVPDPIHQLGSGTILNYVPINLLLWIPLTVLLTLVLKRSGFGRLIYAVGDNPLACRLAGVRVWQVLTTNYALIGVLSAVAGILFVGNTNAADLQLVTPFLLPSVAAVVIGGTSILGGAGGYTGTVFGALILTELGTFLDLIKSSESIKQMLYGVIILVLAWVYTRTAGAE